MIALPPLTRDLVLIGGGHSHALVLRRWAMDPLPGARLTLIDPGPVTAYSGMLPGYVAGHYAARDLQIDLVRLARRAGARLVIGRAEGIDKGARQVRVAGRAPIGFDVASLDIGVTSAMPELPGFAEHAVPVKPLGAFATRWEAFRRAPGPVAVIGGGVAGVELAMAMAHGLGRRAEVTVIEHGRALAGTSGRARTLLLARLQALGVTLIEGAEVAKVEAEALVLADGRRLPAALTVGAAGARAQGWLSETGLETKGGFLSVGETLQTSDPAIFAAGDCAEMLHAPRPKAGVFAVRQAPVLARNLRAALTGGRMRRYSPQRDYLKLISLGEKAAAAEKAGLALASHWLWRWKDRIDRRFMDKLSDLPPMPAPKPPRESAAGADPSAEPMCGGCGAKVGRGALKAALSGLTGAQRDDLEVLPGDDAALLRMGGARQVLSTDHLRAVTDDWSLMTRIACLHALGDVWAMGAQPQAALLTVILPRQSAELQQRAMAEIGAAAEAELTAAGAALIGGHSSMGSELTLGFSVTGLLERDPVTLGGARPGDALILTKPLGSGTILAAEMRGAAQGPDVAACWQAMLQPQGAASSILGPDARAMTDVTGFGLAGHLAAICEASGCGAAIDLGAVPMMQGAEALAAAGVKSTLWQDNRDGAGPVFGAAGQRGALLFDPQTAGGLLAAVPQEAAEELMTRLRAAGYPAARIGTVEALPGIRVA
ncbi:selenide, water dikinase SelD [Pseudoroseicyclus aestuarii]|nr:selenide, water dikinase SelD [Pseudoroseicyclus aestuarii]